MLLYILVFLSGSWLFIGNVLIGYTWAQFIMTHMNIPFTKMRKIIYRIGGLIACLLLIINIFYPLVFSDKGGVYQRGPLYGVFLHICLTFHSRPLLRNQFEQNRCENAKYPG